MPREKSMPCRSRMTVLPSGETVEAMLVPSWMVMILVFEVEAVGFPGTGFVAWENAGTERSRAAEARAERRMNLESSFNGRTQCVRLGTHCVDLCEAETV